MLLQVCRTLRVAASHAAVPSTFTPPPPKVLVLTMTPNGGAVAEALRVLGYHPYVLENALRKGRVQTHPQEWMAVLRHDKPFSPAILKMPDESETTSTAAKVDHQAAATPQSSAAPSPPQYFDAVAGPPATAAFEAILKTCPRSTRVVLVEEPDKLAWEKDMDHWLRPLVERCDKSRRWWRDSLLHTMLLDMVDLRRALIDPARARRERTRSGPSSTAAMAAQNVPLGQQHNVLRLAGALDLFEQHVKEVVPSDRLLVYRVGDGWEPLCEFLKVPVPTQATASAPTTSSTTSSSSTRAEANEAADSASAAVTAPSEAIPFPVNTNGSEVLLLVDQALQRANMVVWFILLAAGSLGLLVLGSFRDETRDMYGDLRRYVWRDFEPYAEKELELTTRQALVMTKRATQRFGQEYEKEGGAAKSLTGVLRRLTGTPEAPSHAAASPEVEESETKAKS